MTRLVQARHGVGPEAVGGLEVTVAPGRECQEAGGSSATERIVITGEVESPTGMRHGALCVAEDLCLSGPVHGDRARQTAKLRFVRNDHLRGYRGAEPPLGAREERLHVLELAVGHERPHVSHAEDGPDPEHVFGKRIQPTAHRPFLAGLSQGRDLQLDHGRSSLEVLASQCMPNGL